MAERLSRRTVLKAPVLPAALAISSMIPETKEITINLGQYRADTIAHNAAINPDKFQSALESATPHIEVDLTVVDGMLVVAHSPAEFYRLPERVKALQDPEFVLAKIRKAGKYPFLDFKDEVENLDSYHGVLAETINNPHAMASSNNHMLLLALKRQGFEGRILFSIGSSGSLNSFLNEGTYSPSSDSFGVSIRHDLLWDKNVGKQLKDRGFSIAAWSPNTPATMADAIKNGADIITSDDFGSLGKISKVSY